MTHPIHSAIAGAALLLCAALHPAAAETLDLKATCHASGDGVGDDSEALRTCLERLDHDAAMGRRSSLHIPAGIFRISGRSGTMPTLRRAGTIIGEGPHASTLLLDPGYLGDVFSWDEAWIANSQSGDHVDFSRDAAGPTIAGLRIAGTRTAASRQNAISFYDRNDHVLLRDIEVDELNGDCLSIGQPRVEPEAFMRESTFENIKCFGTGAPGRASVTLSSSAHPGTDATNEIDIYKLAVFDARFQGVAVRNPGLGSATRGIRFFGLRIEKTGAEGLSIGDPLDRGQVAGITAFDLIVVQSGAAALRIAASASGPQPYGIRVSGGSLGPGNARGIEIDNGRLIDIALDNVDAPIVIGPQAGDDISIAGNGAQSLWRFGGTAKPGAVTDSLAIRSPFSLRGFPGSGDRVGASALRAVLPGGGTARLTMDGEAPSAYNCFNPGYAQAYGLDLRILLQDVDKPARFASWTVSSAVLSAWYGPHSARLRAMPATVLQNAAEGARLTLAADSVDGCLALDVQAPPPASEHWAASALVTFVRAP